MKQSDGLEFWAKVGSSTDSDGCKTIESIIVARADLIASGTFGPPSDYIEITEYDSNGTHPICGVGGKYIPSNGKLTLYNDRVGWNLNLSTGVYEPPTPSPGDDYHWDNASQSWTQVI